MYFPLFYDQHKQRPNYICHSYNISWFGSAHPCPFLWRTNVDRTSKLTNYAIAKAKWRTATPKMSMEVGPRNYNHPISPFGPGQGKAERFRTL